MPIPQRECFRQGWLEAVRTIDHLITNARLGGNLEEVNADIIDRCYKFGENDLNHWANDPGQSDDPPRMDP